MHKCADLSEQSLPAYGIIVVFHAKCIFYVWRLAACSSFQRFVRKRFFFNYFYISWLILIQFHCFVLRERLTLIEGESPVWFHPSLLCVWGLNSFKAYIAKQKARRRKKMERTQIFTNTAQININKNKFYILLDGVYTQALQSMLWRPCR